MSTMQDRVQHLRALEGSFVLLLVDVQEPLSLVSRLQDRPNGLAVSIVSPMHGVQCIVSTVYSVLYLMALRSLFLIAATMSPSYGRLGHMSWNFSCQVRVSSSPIINLFWKANISL
jgi:hypothetical protein